MLMLKFLFRLFLLLLPFGLVWMYLEFKLSTFPTSYSEKEKSIKRQHNEIETLILGSSQSYWALNPDLFSSRAFNLANVSQSIDIDLALANHWIPGMPKLRTIILPISYFTLRTTLEVSTESWRLYFYHHENGLNWSSIKPYTPRAWSKTLLFTVPESVAILFGKEPGFLPDENGWLEVNQVLNESEVAKERVRLHTRIQDKQIEARLCNLLKKNIVKWRSMGIETVLVTLPVTIDYYRYQDKDLISRNQSRIKEFTACGAKYFDLNQSAKFNMADFADFDHLNSKGSQKASRMVDTYVSQLK